MARFTTYLGVDWDKDGNYTDESAYVKSIGVRRGRNGTLDKDGFMYTEPGELWGTLRNTDNRYDPFNTSSPIYGDISPGKPMKVTVTQGATTKDVFYGWITDIRPMGFGSEEAIFRAKDSLEFLQMQGADSIGEQLNYPVIDALNDILDQSDWSVGDILINDNGDIMPKFSTTADNDILLEMRNVSKTFAGTLYVNASGGLVYLNRYEVGVSSGVTLTGDDVMRELEVAIPWEEIYNHVQVFPASGGIQTRINSTSIADYGRRTIRSLDNGYVQNATMASNLAGYILAYSYPEKKILRVKLRNQFANQFTPDLFSAVTVTIAPLSIDAMYVVGQIEHEIRAGGTALTTFRLEPEYGELTGSDVYPLTFPFSLTW